MNLDRIIQQTLGAKRQLVNFSPADRRKALTELVEVLNRDKTAILEANQADINHNRARLRDSDVDRMTLTPGRFDDMVKSVNQIIALPDTVGETYDAQKQASGITTSKMRVPVGAILMIYESRPNVTIDAAALAIKTANAIILKGGSEIERTNNALGEALSKALTAAGLPAGAAITLATNSRSLTAGLLDRSDVIDLVIPRGSRRLLEFVQRNSVIPTLLHLEGNCHVYIDKAADPQMAVKLAVDAKTQRLGTCNTAESLLVHKDIAERVVAEIGRLLTKHKIEIRGDNAVLGLIKNAKPATVDDWSEEYLGPIISVKIVDSLDEAIRHINKHGSGHTDSIVTTDDAAAGRFLREVDAASVMRNTSTRLADGFEYGLGAEIGISTGRLHARGPVGQEGLLTYKWIVESDGVTKGDIVK